MIATVQHQIADSVESLWVRCPRCARDLGAMPYASSETTHAFHCDACFLRLTSEEGIWRALSPERESHFLKFMTEYQIVRKCEGRGTDDSAYYLALPCEDLSGHNVDQWLIRARTFRALETSVFPVLEGQQNSPLNALDIGAGNCWLSYRLALRGHRPVAVDLLTNKFDGLGAAAHYAAKLSRLFPRFQSDATCMPFASSQFDIVIFNASFHYSEDFVATIAEAVRCLRSGGTVIIADTPWYSCKESGEQMIAERQQAFRVRYGFPSDGLNCLEFLTDERLARLEDLFGLKWTAIQPDYGLRWKLRPVIAQIKGRREPSQFRIYLSEVRK